MPVDRNKRILSLQKSNYARSGEGIEVTLTNGGFEKTAGSPIGWLDEKIRREQAESAACRHCRAHLAL